MFACDQLVYIQMQKTGCSHIAALLSRLFGGNQIGKHNAAPREMLRSHKYFVSSIRNPWDWYLSLWTFGLLGKGDLMHRLTNNYVLFYLIAAIKNPISNGSALFHELSKDIDLWREVYGSGDNVESFRKWLRLILDTRNARFLGEGYGKTAIVDICGFMTFRYLYLCCQNIEALNNPGIISNYTDLVQFEKQNCYIDFFIRQEALESNLIEAVERVRLLTPEEKELIHGAEKKNTSKRSHPISEYYDSESIELVGRRDNLLIDKFGYSPPG